MTTLDKVALVGTGRLADAPSTGTPVDDLIATLQDLTAEHRVLLSAGMLSIVRRAGYVPAAAAPLPMPAPEETLPACSHAAAQALRDVFIDARLELLPEAFQLLTRTGLRVPFSLLVDCLDLRDRAQRDAARPVLGERGVWLAQYRAVWQWARDRVEHDPGLDELKRIWEEGRPDDRLAAIIRVRKMNPPVAREWVATSWKQEPSELRLSLISALASQLSNDDEAFLQTALKDRAGAVRAAAASLLARLTDSTFAARAIARSDALLDIARVQPSGMWDHHLTVTARPPERFNPEWEADGFSVKPPRGVGERAHWLMQALALVDPAHWSERASAPPPELTRAAWRGEWGATVMIAWSRAALLHDSKDWIIALWDAWLDADVSADPHAGAMRRELLMQLFGQLPPDIAQDRVATLLQRPLLAADLDFETMLDNFDRPWPDALGAALLAAIDSATATAAGSAWSGPQLARLLRAAAPALPATLFDRALAIASRDSVRAVPTRVTLDFDEFAHQVRLRQRLHQEIAR